MSSNGNVSTYLFFFLSSFYFLSWTIISETWLFLNGNKQSISRLRRRQEKVWMFFFCFSDWKALKTSSRPASNATAWVLCWSWDKDVNIWERWKKKWPFSLLLAYGIFLLEMVVLNSGSPSFLSLFSISPSLSLKVAVRFGIIHFFRHTSYIQNLLVILYVITGLKAVHHIFLLNMSYINSFNSPSRHSLKMKKCNYFSRCLLELNILEKTTVDPLHILL